MFFFQEKKGGDEWQELVAWESEWTAAYKHTHTHLAVMHKTCLKDSLFIEFVYWFVRILVARDVEFGYVKSRYRERVLCSAGEREENSPRPPPEKKKGKREKKKGGGLSQGCR